MHDTNCFIYENNNDEYDVELAEYLEDSNIFRMHCFYSSNDLKEKNGKERISIYCGTRIITISSVINDQYYCTLYEEIYEYSYRKIKDFILDENNLLFDERIEQLNDKKWVRVMVKLNKKTG